MTRPDISGAVKVLIVDDNRTNQGILEGLLKNWGMRPASSRGGEGALLQLRAAHESGDPYKLILIDLHMPGMDGFELIEHVRQLPGATPATIMMLTSRGQHGDAVRCAELGISAHLLKPVRPSELQDAIGRVIGGRDPAAAPQFPPEVACEPTESLRVLLVEDNAVNQKVATRLLEKRGHQVAVTSNGREALAALEKDTYDVVLMDMQMPEMDGFEATRTIRAMEKGTALHQQIVALTAHALTTDRERCMEAGTDDYLTKPIRPRELDELLDSCLQRSAGSRQI
jgi:CheY-like chemotaxis protein